MNERRICIVIQSRLSSSRLPAKALLPLGGLPSVLLCALRAANTGLSVIVATSYDETDDGIANLCNENNIACFRGALQDVLTRITAALEAYDNDDWVVRLTADNVFPDGSFLNLLLNAFDPGSFDYLGISSIDGCLPYGLSAEIFKIHVLREANQKASTSFDREHVTPYIKRNARSQQFLLENVSPSWKDLRCTLDTFQDYILLLRLFQQIKDPVQIPWIDLVQQLESLNLNRAITEVKNITCHKYKKFTLGTAQLGLPYGIANKSGLPTESAACKLIDTAVTAGISTLDTARAYGLSEQRIGKVIQDTNANNVEVISKLGTLDYLDSGASDEQVRHAVRASIYETCYHLKLMSISTLLLHRWEHRYRWRSVAWDELILLKKAGLIKKIGVSVKTPAEAMEALKDPVIEHIQCPVNILDWRWRQSDFLEASLKRQDVVFFARSVYLQGLLTMSANSWPHFPGVDIPSLTNTLSNLVIRFERINHQDLCLAYVRGLPWIASLVLGMETEMQLSENMGLFGEKPLTPEQISEVHRAIPYLPESFLDPAQWK